MNERIKLIAEQAGIAVWGDAVYMYDPKDTLDSTVMAKFAELIVRECALVAKTLPHTPERHWVQDSVTYIPVHCEQNILKHFGVEE